MQMSVGKWVGGRRCHGSTDHKKANLHTITSQDKDIRRRCVGDPGRGFMTTKGPARLWLAPSEVCVYRPQSFLRQEANTKTENGQIHDPGQRFQRPPLKLEEQANWKPAKIRKIWAPPLPTSWSDWLTDGHTRQRRRTPSSRDTGMLAKQSPGSAETSHSKCQRSETAPCPSDHVP